ncbi:hypothetical protein ORI20_19175 [Mycobacterium sp. CVI_P3]|uniref:Reverse transcriptase domain-containing protein n=1 Tax=Mycobacterium pinniadriaticum TaxID=2994102 RepID=A0ABT3SGW9_9MYCO|nr:hypothetical protein [Mycobacterium pinniadriaticum]MCX2932399.1 hypothetical protein [Mycobacterium pinniadriaticum]MCX2938744.1 hypothetical protein [Mycobacterium pinniadriaticum]
MPDPVDIERQLADPKTYEATILRIFTKKRQRGMTFSEVADDGVTYFDTVTNRRTLARVIARSVADGRFQPQPVDLWILDTNGKRRAAHMPVFTDHVVGSALFQLISHNACCYGLPGVYSYLPGKTNVTAMRALADYVRAHRARTGDKGPPLYVLQSDFEHYGDNLPVGPDAALWPILREVVALGSRNGVVPQHVWDLITRLARPIVRDQEGAHFTRVHGVAMGTPLVPILADLAVVPMDKAILDIDGIFYARYNDDFLFAHHDLSAMHEADARIDALLDELGVKRKLGKELRTALSPTGRPCPSDPAYRGRGRVTSLGLSVSHAGTVSVAPHRLRRFIARVAARIDGVAAGLGRLPAKERARQLVVATNVMLDLTNPFAVAGLSSLLDTTTDRGTLKDLDYRIARKIVQAATGRPGVRGFRVVPPAMLRAEMGLVSLVYLRNQR